MIKRFEGFYNSPITENAEVLKLLADSWSIVEYAESPCVGGYRWYVLLREPVAIVDVLPAEMQKPKGKKK